MSTADNYLRDVLPQLITRALEARRDAVAEPSGGREGDFAAGRRVAYYEVVAMMLGQLEAFGIARVEVGVPERFDAERDLL